MALLGKNKEKGNLHQMVNLVEKFSKKSWDATRSHQSKDVKWININAGRGGFECFVVNGQK